MKRIVPFSRMHRRTLITALPLLAVIGKSFAPMAAEAQAPPPRPLASWNDGPSKQAILEFVRATTEQGSPRYVAPADRIATFDQDGTLWVEHPLYTQAMFALDRVRELAPKHPEWKTHEPFKAILS